MKDVISIMVNKWNVICGYGVSGGGVTGGGPAEFTWISPVHVPDDFPGDNFRDGEWIYDPETDSVLPYPEGVENHAKGMVYDGFTNTWSYPEPTPEPEEPESVS